MKTLTLFAVQGTAAFKCELILIKLLFPSLLTFLLLCLLTLDASAVSLTISGPTAVCPGRTMRTRLLPENNHLTMLLLARPSIGAFTQVVLLLRLPQVPDTRSTGQPPLPVRLWVIMKSEWPFRDVHLTSTLARQFITLLSGSYRPHLLLLLMVW